MRAIACSSQMVEDQICRWQPEGLEAQPASMRPQTLQQAEAAGTDFEADDAGFGTNFDPRSDQQGFAGSRQPPPHRLGLRFNAAARLTAPELLDEAGPFFDDSANQPIPKAKKVAILVHLIVSSGLAQAMSCKLPTRISSYNLRWS